MYRKTFQIEPNMKFVCKSFVRYNGRYNILSHIILYNNSGKIIHGINIIPDFNSIINNQRLI